MKKKKEKLLLDDLITVKEQVNDMIAMLGGEYEPCTLSAAETIREVKAHMQQVVQVLQGEQPNINYAVALLHDAVDYCQITQRANADAVRNLEG